MRLLSSILVLSAALAACAGADAPGRAAPGAGPPPTADRWTEWAARLDAADPVERFVQATALFLGTPYANGPLGEGEAGGPDPDPRADLARVDCVTYLEESLALALADPADDASFLRVLDAVRYRGGAVGFVERNHYMVRDWIPANAWLLTDVTAEVGGGAVRTVRRTIDRAAFLREQGAEPRPGVDDPREMSLAMIPSASAADVAPRLRSGDLVFWIGKADGIFVVHTGLVVRDPGGGLLFRHGSSRAGRVLDEPFRAYAESAGFTEGFVVMRLRADAVPPAG